MTPCGLSLLFGDGGSAFGLCYFAGYVCVSFCVHALGFASFFVLGRVFGRVIWPRGGGSLFLLVVDGVCGVSGLGSVFCSSAVFLY